MNIHTYKNIIFDLGGVILDIAPQKTINSFADYVKEKMVNKGYLYKTIIEGNILIDYEKGNINDDEFRTLLCKELNIKISDNQFDKAFNAMLLNYTSARIELLTNLAKSHNIYLLSNTCHIHYLFYDNLLKRKFSINGLSDLFKQIFLSFEMGMRKPNADIYREVIRQIGIKPNESVFIDDNELNIQAALSMGIKGILKPSEIDLVTLF